MVTDFATLNPESTYSYADYLLWKFDGKVELIKGRISKMTPAPKAVHQKIVWHIGGILYRQLRGSDCQVFQAPYDVRFLDKERSKEDKNIYTVVQPDISIICDETKLDERGCIGAPDCIIEVASKSTLEKDINTKYQLYQENGVKEYWIVFPNEKAVLAYDLDENGKYQARKIDEDERYVQMKTLGDFQIDQEELFG